MNRVIKDIDSRGTRTLSGARYENLPFSEKGKEWHQNAIAMVEHEALKNADADGLLLRTYVTSERPVHIRRALDRSYYWTLKDTSARDRDQVVYRATLDQNPKVVMLDGSMFCYFALTHSLTAHRTGDHELPKTLGKKATRPFWLIQNDTRAACRPKLLD